VTATGVGSAVASSSRTSSSKISSFVYVSLWCSGNICIRSWLKFWCTPSSNVRPQSKVRETPTIYN